MKVEGEFSMFKRAFAGLGVAILLAGVAIAGPFEDGYAAFESGDYAQAMKWFRLGADQGDAFAQYNLGFMYQEGQGVPQDYAEAVKWYRLAADQGLANAQSNLGNMYYNGQGVLQDYVLAHMWFNLAAARGEEAAVKNRDVTASEMTPDQLTEAQRLARDWKPSQ